MKKLLIVGTGGQAKSVLDCAEASGHYSGISFLAKDTGAEQIVGYPIFYEQEMLPSSFVDENMAPSFWKGFDEVVVAIGNNQIRLKKTLQFSNCGIRLATLIHPRAIVSRFSEIHGGTVILANAVVNSFSIIGTACIINTGAIIEHDCIISDGVHVSPNATVAGGVTIGKESLICVGSSIADHVRIGANSVIGAGGVVLCDVPDRVLAAGIPAKIKKIYG